MADDKKDLKQEEPTKSGPAAPEQKPPGKDAPPTKEAAGSPPVKEAPAPEKDSGPKQEKTDAAGPADKSRPGNVIDISGAMIDKIVAEKEKAAKVAEAGKGQPAGPEKTEQKDKKEPEKQAGRAPKAVKKAPEKSDKPTAAKKAEPKKRPRPRRSRRNRKNLPGLWRPRVPGSRNRLSTSTCPSSTPSKITHFRCVMMKKCGRWLPVSRIRA